MDSSGKFSYSLRKYPVIRVLSVIFIISVILGSIYLIGFRTKPVPEIISVVPPDPSLQPALIFPGLITVLKLCFRQMYRMVFL